MAYEPSHDSVQGQADLGMAILDGEADAWAEEVNLTAMIKNATSPMKLNRNAPQNVRDDFHHRMEVQIYAIVRQTYIEAAFRTICKLQDERAARAKGEH